MGSSWGLSDIHECMYVCVYIYIYTALLPSGHGQHEKASSEVSDCVFILGSFY